MAVDAGPRAQFCENFAVFPSVLLQRVLARPALMTLRDRYGEIMRRYDDAGGDALNRMSRADLQTYLARLLTKQDQMSMAASIESRVPFLDHVLVEFASALPDVCKLSGLTTKRILRDAMKTMLPASILNRPKMGFPVPLNGWLRGRWNAVASDVLLDRRSRERGVIDPKAVELLLRDHASGRANGTDRLWSLLNLELWFRTFIDKQGVQTLAAPLPVQADAYSVA